MLHINTDNQGPIAVVNGQISSVSAMSECDREAMAETLSGMIPMLAAAA